MTERVRFYFDPICPWAYQTSRWIRRLAALGEVELDWGLFSLEIANADREESRRKGHARSEHALRTIVAVRAQHGPAAVGAFYAALGEHVHQRGEALEDPEVLRAALADADLDGALADRAMSDPATWKAVMAEHAELVDATRSFGVPTIVLDGGDGPAIFGPVLSEVPDDTDAVALWRHVAWLTRYDNFSELKRERVRTPDLASVR